MRFDILSLFPELFESPLKSSLLKKAIDKEILQVNLVDIRDFAESKHNTVDDKPYGGGAGMLLKPEPLARAIEHCTKNRAEIGSLRVVYLSPQGKTLNAAKCRELASYDHLVLLCGHYEGIDARIVDSLIDEEVSIGDYVLTSGCLPALVLLDSVSRFVRGVVGSKESVDRDSFELGVFAPPQYTRPEEFRGMRVPEVLLSGNHAEIEKWKAKEARAKTLKQRPDLIDKEHKV